MVYFLVISNMQYACKLLDLNSKNIKCIKVSSDIIKIYYFDDYQQTINLHFIANIKQISSKKLYHNLISIEKG